MGLFSNLKKIFQNEARSKRKSSHKVMQLVEPNYGRIVTLQVISFANRELVEMQMGSLLTHAAALNVKLTASGKNVTLECPNSEIAEAIRESWK